MNPHFSDGVNKSVRLDTVFKSSTVTDVLKSQQVEQVNITGCARCCAHIAAYCWNPLISGLSNAGNSIKSLSERKMLQVFPTEARCAAISRQSLQATHEQVIAMLSELQTCTTESKGRVIQKINLAREAAEPLTNNGKFNFDEILRVRIANSQLTAAQCSNALKSTEETIKKNTLSVELRFIFHTIQESLKNLAQQPNLAHRSEKILTFRKVINDEKCLSSLNKFLCGSNPRAAREAFQNLEKNVDQQLKNLNHRRENFDFSSNEQIKDTKYDARMVVIKEMLCKHSFYFLKKENEKILPNKQLEEILSYLHPQKLNALDKAEFDFEKVSSEQLRIYSHLNGKKLESKQLESLGSAIMEMITSSKDGKSSEQRGDVVTRQKVLEIIAETAASKQYSKRRVSSESGRESSATHFIVSDGQINHGDETKKTTPESKKSVSRERSVKWTNQLPEKISHAKFSANELLKSIHVKKILLEKFFIELQPSLKSFSQSQNQNQAVTRFEVIAKAASQLVAENFHINGIEGAIQPTREDIEKTYKIKRDSLLKDMLIISFPLQEYEAKRGSDSDTREPDKSLAKIGHALSLLPKKIIDELIYANRGCVILSSQERASIHRHNKQARDEGKPEAVFNHPEVQFFDNGLKKSSDNLDEFLANLEDFPPG